MKSNKMQIHSYSNTNIPNDKEPKVQQFTEDNVAILDRFSKPVFKHPNLMKDGQAVYSRNIVIKYVPTEGAIVPKLLTVDNLMAMSQEFKTNHNKEMNILPNTTYSLSYTSPTTVTDLESGEVVELVKAHYKPTYKRIISSLSF